MDKDCGQIFEKSSDVKKVPRLQYNRWKEEQKEETRGEAKGRVQTPVAAVEVEGTTTTVRREQNFKNQYITLIVGGQTHYTNSRGMCEIKMHKESGYMSMTTATH